MTEQTYLKSYGGTTFITSRRTVGIFKDDLLVYRCLDYVGKTVLDIGGFTGETAVLFHVWGAKKVTVVEGAPENIPLIVANLDMHHISAHVELAFVGRENGTRIVHHGTVKCDYGLATTPRAHARLVDVRKLAEVVEPFWPPDIVKCDCEGGEEGFLTMPDAMLKQVPAYVMEWHGAERQRLLMAKFEACGYLVTTLKPGRSKVVLARRSQ